MQRVSAPCAKQQQPPAGSVQRVGSSLVCGYVNVFQPMGASLVRSAGGAAFLPGRAEAAASPPTGCRGRGGWDLHRYSGWVWLVKGSPGAASPGSTATTLTPGGGLGHRVFCKNVPGVCLTAVRR